MTVYLVQLFVILILEITFHPSYSQKGKRRYLICCFFLLTLVSGFRADSVGADTHIYVDLYKKINEYDFSSTRFESGYLFYSKLLHRLDPEPLCLLLVSSAICIGTVCIFIYFYSKRPTISMWLYVTMGLYFSQMNILRQAIALSIGAWAFMIVFNEKWFNERKLLRLIIPIGLILLAASFHSIAIVYAVPLVMMTIYGKGMKTGSQGMNMSRMLLQILLTAFGVFVLYTMVMNLAIRFFPKYQGYFTGLWSDENYSASLLSTLIALSFLAVGVSVFYKKDLDYLQKCALVMVGFNFIFGVLSMRMEIWGRLTGMFTIYTYFIWTPEFLNGIKLKSNRRIVETAIALAGLAYMLVILIFRPEWTLVVPYVLRPK